MVCVYFGMILLRLLQNQRHLPVSREQIFLLLEDCFRNQLIFLESAVTRHKVNIIIVNYLKWAVLKSLTERSCHNWGDFILVP